MALKRTSFDKRRQRVRTSIRKRAGDRKRLSVHRSGRHIYVQLIDDAPVALQLPQTVTLQVVDTPPELKGGTATKRPKPARLATGIEIMVPEYIGNGEKVWVNTTTGEFSGRAD